MEIRTLFDRLYLLSTLFVLFAPAAAAQHVNIDGSESIIFPPGNNVPLLRSLSTSVHLLGQYKPASYANLLSFASVSSASLPPALCTIRYGSVADKYLSQEHP